MAWAQSCTASQWSGFGLPRLYSTGKGCQAPFPILWNSTTSALPIEPKPQGPQRDAVFDPHGPPRFPLLLVDLLVHDPALGGKAALGPHLLDMDQGALAGTENIVLQGRDHDEVIFGIWSLAFTRLIFSTSSAI